MMSDLLKGNFKPKHSVSVDKDRGLSLEDRFEREALKYLGGSICYVAKKTVKWTIDSDVD